MQSFDAPTGRVNTLDIALITGTEVSVQEVNFNEGSAGDLTVTSSLTLNGADVSEAVNSVGPATTDSATGGVSIPWTKLNGDSGTITFNVADTVYFQQAVSAAYTSGQNSIQMLKSWNSSTATISRVLSGGTINNITITLSAVAGITYNTSAHTYTASAQAKADNAVRASDSTNSGTEAYEAGWAAAKAKISRSNNYIQGPPSTVDGAAVNLFKAEAWCNKGSTVYYASNGQINAPNGRYVPEGGITWGINWTSY